MKAHEVICASPMPARLRIAIYEDDGGGGIECEEAIDEGESGCPGADDEIVASDDAAWASAAAWLVLLLLLIKIMYCAVLCPFVLLCMQQCNDIYNV